MLRDGRLEVAGSVGKGGGSGAAGCGHCGASENTSTCCRQPARTVRQHNELRHPVGCECGNASRGLGRGRSGASLFACSSASAAAAAPRMEVAGGGSSGSFRRRAASVTRWSIVCCAAARARYSTMRLATVRYVSTTLASCPTQMRRRCMESVTCWFMQILHDLIDQS
jgi:hypothetical protein